MNIAIIGAGDLGKVLAYHIENDSNDKVVGFLDDNYQQGELIKEKPVLGNIDEAQRLFDEGQFDQLLIAIGYNHFEFRASVFENMKSIAPIYTFIHSSSYVDTSNLIAAGVFIFPGCVVDRGCVIEENVLLNTGVIIAHDSKVKEHSFLGPGVNIAGFSIIGSKCFLGIGSIILNNLSISDLIIVGAGALVNKSLTEKGTYIGVPAKLKL